MQLMNYLSFRRWILCVIPERLYTMPLYSRTSATTQINLSVLWCLKPCGSESGLLRQHSHPLPCLFLSSHWSLTGVLLNSSPCPQSTSVGRASGGVLLRSSCCCSVSVQKAEGYVLSTGRGCVCLSDKDFLARMRLIYAWSLRVRHCWMESCLTV